MTVTVTLAQLLRLQTAFAWAQQQVAEAQSDDEVVEIATKVEKTLVKQAPGLASRVRKWLGSPAAANAAAWVGAVTGIVALFLAHQSQTLDEQVIEHFLKEQQTGSSQTEPGAPSSITPPASSSTPRPPGPAPEQFHVSES